jgi:hypothetical protein
MAQKVAKCCCCGQILPPKIKFTGPVKQRIYDYVVRHHEGVNRFQIMEAVYADDPDGGPESHSTIGVHIMQMNNQVLRQHGFIIRSAPGRNASGYRLIAL